MSDKQSIEFTSGVKTEAAAAYLEALAAGLRAGHISIQSGVESAHLEVAGDVTLEIEAKSTADKGKSSVDISLAWRVERKRPAASAPTLMITSDPAPVAEQAPEPEMTPESIASSMPDPESPASYN